MLRAARGPLLIVALIALLLLGLWLWLRTSLPTLEGQLELAGLAGTVEITRDDFGVALIEAESQEDLYFALGFVHAQDRLWQMEHLRLQASGSLAQLFGEEAVASDLLMRTLGLEPAAERTVEGLSARAVGTLQAYSDGVNAYLESHGGPLPIEFGLLGHTPAEWTPTDVALLQKLMAWEWNRGAAGELFRSRLAARLDEQELQILLGREVGSRADTDSYSGLPLAELGELLGADRPPLETDGWVLAGELTVDGAPLLTVEAHGQPSIPTPWYPVRLRAPGLRVAGASSPGTPLLFSGRNDYIAWALLPGSTDTQDLVLLRSDRPGSYRVAEEQREFENRQETIVVRGGDDVTVTVRESVAGPVISDMAGGRPAGDGEEEASPVALRWSALMPGDSTLQGGLDLLHADGWEEFRAAASNLDELHGTALYADVEGRIGRQEIGRRPARGVDEGLLPSQLRNGGGWGDWVQFRRLEQESHGSDARIIGEIGSDGLVEQIASLASHTALSSARVLELEFLPGTGSLLEVLSSAVPTTEEAKRAHAELLGWRGELGTGSAAPLIFAAWVPALAEALLADELGTTLAIEAASYPLSLRRALDDGSWCDDTRTPEAEDCRDVASLALARAVELLAEAHGADLAEWPRDEGDSGYFGHRVFDDTLVAPLFRVGPSGDDPETRVNLNAPVYRAVYELVPDEADGWGSSGFLIPTGVSGNPFSPHFRDLLQRWRDVALVPLLPTEGEGSTLILQPRR